MTRSEGVPAFVDHLFRRTAGQMVSTLTRILGTRHLDLAEDVVQEALIRALEQWPFRGIPENPTAWLIEVAKNRALDRLRRDASLASKRDDLLAAFPAVTAAGFEPAYPFQTHWLRDDQLAMMFLCCHPEIPEESRVALTLKTVGGFSVKEIARAFLSDEAAVAQRIVRAKRQIRERAIDLGVPVGAALLDRLDSVLGVLYLMFNEGYLSRGSGSGEDSHAPGLIREDVCNEALRLGLLLASYGATDLPKVHALLALFYFHSSRFASRVSAEGDLVALADQDRAKWDRSRIEQGLLHLTASAEGDEESDYHLEAAIASAHAVAADVASTDWGYITTLYESLFQRKATPVVALNRAIAIGYGRGPEAGLAALREIELHPSLANYYLLFASQAHFCELLSFRSEAAELYRAALACECAPAERRLLERRLDRVYPSSSAIPEKNL
ncbi:MAG: sigma-70 family RNA polymerase sigma factor [Bryobacteraceae bacterium]